MKPEYIVGFMLLLLLFQLFIFIFFDRNMKWIGLEAFRK